MAECSAKTANGQPCKRIAMPPSQYCYAHNPERAAARRRNASKGGKTGGRGRPGADLGEIKDQLKAMLGGVLSGRILPGVAAVATQIQNSRLRAVEVERRLKETQELMERIEALEAAARMMQNIPVPAVNGWARPKEINTNGRATRYVA